MAFTVKPFKEVIGYTKEKLDTALAPIRARSAKAKADMLSAETEEKMVNLERKICEKTAEKDIDLNRIIDLIDEYELLERKQKQVQRLIGELFPEE